METPVSPVSATRPRVGDLRPDATGFAYVLRWMDYLIEMHFDADESYLVEWRQFVADCQTALSQSRPSLVEQVLAGCEKCGRKINTEDCAYDNCPRATSLIGDKQQISPARDTPSSTERTLFDEWQHMNVVLDESDRRDFLAAAAEHVRLHPEDKSLNARQSRLLLALDKAARSAASAIEFAMPTEKEIARYRDTFRAALDHNMDTKVSCASPSTDAHRKALTEFCRNRADSASDHG